jgi:N-acetylmuramoyl-L-alanine amidase
MLEKSLEYVLPHFNQRPESVLIDTIVIHYTGKKDCVSWYLEALEIGVSAHYLISKQGKIFAVVPEHLRAWHAGESSWMGREKVNDFSIGIELDNNGNEPFSIEQMLYLVKLIQELIAKYSISHLRVLGHSDVAPSRKRDPGKLFDWKFLAKNNIGIIPPKTALAIPETRKIQEMLAQYGYKIEITGEFEQQTLNVMQAFNDHFNQECTTHWDDYSQGALNELLSYLLK